MPSLANYKRIHANSGNTEGRARKLQSDIIMEATWDRDIQSCTAYIYDFFHDSEPFKLRNLNSPNDQKKIPVEIKYIVNGSQTYDKDPITYHIQFKPSYKCNVPYYKDMYEKKYDGLFPLGLYIDIPDNEENFNRWLIVDKANYFDPQFSTYEVLQCDYLFQWVYEGKKNQMAGVLRSQNSYNSGIWQDYKISSPEDQQKFIVPLNHISEHLYYNQRLIVDARVTKREPNAWLVSKIKSFAPNALNRITMTQDRFDQHRDLIEKNEFDEIIGMWADYYTNDVPLKESNCLIPKSRKSEITHSGMKPELKVGGSYKTFTMNFFDDSGNIINDELYNWILELDGVELKDSDILKVLYPDVTNKLSENQIKIKFVGSEDYLNSTLTIKNEYTALNVKIVGM